MSTPKVKFTKHFSKKLYPACHSIGLKYTKVWRGKKRIGVVITGPDLLEALITNELSEDQFDRYFGCQTASEYGVYPWDVEAVLVRMLTGRKTGTQLILD